MEFPTLRLRILYMCIPDKLHMCREIGKLPTTIPKPHEVTVPG
jgi:hypothetical protein